jgi:hypothetical protein
MRATNTGGMWSRRENQTYVWCGGCHLMEGEAFDTNWQDLDADFSTITIKQEYLYTSEASWPVMMFSSANNTWNWHFWYWHQVYLDCEQQLENMKLVLLRLDSGQELNRKDIEGFIGYSRAFIRPMVQEICLLEVDKCCWNSEHDWFRANWLFWILTKIRNENSRTLNTKRVDILPRFFGQYSRVSSR